MNSLRSLPILLAVLLFTATALPAQERFILLVDGSGSMWGEVDGEDKIVILRRSLERLLAEITTEAEVGLVAFGHREKGNCNDIEELVPPLPFDPELLGAAIRSIQPKGKTPLAAAVRKAAESLKYTEERATVVILGDGRESCGMDPCTTAEELEATGVDLTVHAIAFDLADEEGTRQLKCFAQSTGGLFLEASKPDELVAALEQVREVVAPEPAEPAGLALVARDSATGAPVKGALQWTFIHGETEVVTAFEAASGATAPKLAPGEYDVVVESAAGIGEARARVGPGQATELVVEIVATAPVGLVLSSDTVQAGQVLDVEWTADSAPDDFLFILPRGAPDNQYARDEYRRHVVRDGPVARLVAPAEPGDYEVRYFRLAADGLLYRAAFRVTEAAVTIDSPPEALAGGMVRIEWSGPAAPRDLLFVAPVDWKLNTYPLDEDARVAATAPGTLDLPVPPTPGRHEIRYFSWANATVLARVPLDVTLLAASLSAPDKVPAGSVTSVEFTGPRAEGDSLFFMPEGTEDNRYFGGESSDLVRKGSPAQITAPAEPGRYELRYFSRENGGLLARRAITITEPEVALSAPRLVQRGERFELGAKGPGAPGDIVFLMEKEAGDNRYPGALNDRFSPGPDGGGFLDDEGLYVFELVAPAQPGQYEIRYMSWPNAAVLARRTLIVR
ncbi:VWA domain-containing protein [Tropicimonas sp. IMCC6043]|uniref:vWA domain-containing protein n=1 Tax=Tropicimonas sp. IMCC6043 TaxID=2510645 RepID=UPI00101B9D2D|nr:VWA domain-containing protein [Tropicimonas sp. IMCC6043]RYH09188.1 VWA domain-containing protein [Tropicimonas sp. IMCC6043]